MKLCAILGIFTFFIASSDFSNAQHMPARNNSVYINPVLKLANVRGEWDYIAGGRAGYYITDKFTVGAAVFAMISEHQLGRMPYGDGQFISQKLYMSAGGGYFEYYVDVHPNYLISVNAFTGISRISYDIFFDDGSPCPEIEKLDLINSDIVFFAEPGFTLEGIISGGLRAAAGVSFRLIPSTSLRWVNPGDINGAALNFSIKYVF